MLDDTLAVAAILISSFSLYRTWRIGHLDIRLKSATTLAEIAVLKAEIANNYATQTVRLNEYRDLLKAPILRRLDPATVNEWRQAIERVEDPTRSITESLGHPSVLDERDFTGRPPHEMEVVAGQYRAMKGRSDWHLRTVEETLASLKAAIASINDRSKPTSPTSG